MSTFDLAFIETEENIQRSLRLRPIRQLLRELMAINRLDEALLLSLDDPKFRVFGSDARPDEIKRIISLLDKIDELKLSSSVKSELKRIGDIMIYNTRIDQNYLLILFSSDSRSLLEAGKLQELKKQFEY